MRKIATAVCALGGLLAAHTANAAGIVFVLGTDAISFHGASSYINPVFDQMANFGTKKLLFANDWGASGVNYTAGNITIEFQPLSFIDTGANMSPYSAVYVDSPGGCCSDAGGLMQAGGAAVLSSFVAGGGSVGVGDYQGHAFWDSILGFAGAPGVTNAGTCEDPGLSTPGGLSFGFNASYSNGCFTHQTYSPAFWASKGYFALQTNGNIGSPTHGDWVTMATGFTDPGTVPEPVSLSLFGLGVIALGALRRRRAA